MLTTLASIALALASLVLGETAQIGPLSVRRASLFGFELHGAERVHVLDLDEAVQILTRAARHASAAPVPPSAFAPAHFKTCDWIGCPGCKTPEPPADLLIAPHETFPGHRAETWRRGPVAERRERQLRRALGPSVTRRSSSYTERHTAEIGSNRVTIETVEFTYAASPRVPPIAAA
jgi:hypothetical protein